MKWPFSKRRNTDQHSDSAQMAECSHKWSEVMIDGSECWYIDYDIDGKSLEYAIYEPYVCIHCRARKDVKLEGTRYIQTSSNKEAREALEAILRKHPQIKDRADVEDAINDLQLVDREYLRIAQALREYRGGAKFL